MSWRRCTAMWTHLPMEKMAAISHTTFSNELSWIQIFYTTIRISLKFVPKDQFDNKTALVRVMAWLGDTPLPELMLTVHRRLYAAPGGDELTALLSQMLPLQLQLIKLVRVDQSGTWLTFDNLHPVMVKQLLWSHYCRTNFDRTVTTAKISLVKWTSCSQNVTNTQALLL